jgi:TonB family protein
MMPINLRFWGNVALIAVAHVAIIVVLIHWSRESKDTNAQSIVWMNGGGGNGVVAEKRNPPPVKSPAPQEELKTDALKNRGSDEDRPFLASAQSEIQLPTPTLTSTPARSPKPTPKVKVTLKSTPKPTPKPFPKKMVLAKASPKPAPIPKITPRKAGSEPAEGPSEKTEIAKAVPVKEEPKESKKSAATQTGSGKGTTVGTGNGRAGGNASAGQFSWYGSMLHDRFYSEWVQPTTVANTEAKNSVLVKLRIEKDGRVSNFEVIRPSGNAELDDSVNALANRVSHVEPLPDGLGKGDHYDVKINFELNSE